MPHAVSVASPGLQALILCGPGSSFPTFTANPDENPKALLPIANRPMVWYALDFCYRTGITDITLICPPSAAEAITAALKTNPFLTGLPLPSPNLLAPKDLDQNTGTAEILRLPEIREVVNSDFIVLPCDLVCELGGDSLLQAWMVKSETLSDLFQDKRSKGVAHSGGIGVWYNTKTASPIKGEETDFIVTTSLPEPSVLPPKGSILADLAKLVYSLPSDSLNDLTEERNGFPLRHGLLRTHPNARMRMSHRDAHIYIFPQWVMDLVQENQEIENIGEDIVGWWAKAGWQVGLAEKLGMDKIFSSGETEDEQSYGQINSSPIRRSLEESDSNTATQLRNPEIVADDRKTRARSSTELIPPFLAYIHPSTPSAPLVRRVDTAPSLLATSLLLAKLPSVEETGPDNASPFAHARKVAYPEGVKSRTTITKQDSLLAENVTVDEKSAIKESVIGANCQIQEGAKLSQCVLMEGVVVGKGCKLTRCILGKRSEIGEGSILTDCEVQENLLVEAQTEAKDDKLMSSEGLEATEEEMQAAEDFDMDDDADDS